MTKSVLKAHCGIFASLVNEFRTHKFCAFLRKNVQKEKQMTWSGADFSGFVINEMQSSGQNKNNYGTQTVVHARHRIYRKPIGIQLDLCIQIHLLVTLKISLKKLKGAKVAFLLLWAECTGLSPGKKTSIYFGNLVPSRLRNLSS